MQAIWMVMMTFVLVLSGVLRSQWQLTSRPGPGAGEPHSPSLRSTGAQGCSGHLPAAFGDRPLGVVEGHSPRVW
jgi:hypothetical protein